ncbi:MAG: DNA-3-methyladenine glycosylase I [Chromatiaceae bacterium]|nr:DNA-3-methyladenine glycosylase I [Chromatiaceae bacterium]MCP5314881.1 DNA-3-methyladenine glycosylase I [Chromatiaceae bacterium]
MLTLHRCAWASGVTPEYIAYHDREWGVPNLDDRHLFEMLILEGAQAGLSWATILKKREGYRRAFDGFDARKIARYDPARKALLLADPGIVRNRLKVDAAIGNARAYLDLLAGGERLSDFLWQFVDGKPIQNRWKNARQVPVTTPQSDAMSRALKQRGFKFVGSTICYAFMQAVGMVNDHTTDCFRHAELSAVRRPPRR